MAGSQATLRLELYCIGQRGGARTRQQATTPATSIASTSPHRASRRGRQQAAFGAESNGLAHVGTITRYASYHSDRFSRNQCASVLAGLFSRRPLVKRALSVCRQLRRSFCSCSRLATHGGCVLFERRAVPVCQHRPGVIRAPQKLENHLLGSSGAPYVVIV
jgi:hypothetical protein